MLVGKLVGGMHFGVTIGAQRSFVGTTNDRGLRTLTHIALDLHRARNTALLHLLAFLLESETFLPALESATGKLLNYSSKEKISL